MYDIWLSRYVLCFADDLSMASDDGELSQTHPSGKTKAKRGSVLGKLKGIFGKKKRTRSNDPSKTSSSDKHVLSTDAEADLASR